jgi:hypothetical protein
MTQAIFAKSGLSITGDEIYQILNGRIRAIQADTSNNQVVVYLEKKDNSLDTNESTTERLYFDVDAGNEATAAEDIIRAINGLAKHAQTVKIADIPSRSVNGVNGVRIPAFTIASSAVSVAADIGPTLATATVGANYTVSITKDSDAEISLTKTGTIATASDALEVFTVAEVAAEGFVATDACTISVTLSVPLQPSSSLTVTSSVNLTA